MREIWKFIPGLNGYYSASDLGRARSEKRTVITSRGRKIKIPQKILKLTMDRKGGYFNSCLSDGNKRKLQRIHRCVMLAFVGPKPDGYLVRHLDGDVTNNKLSNLKYGTPSENAADSVAHGTSGGRPGSKLTKKKALIIRDSKRDDSDLAEEFGISEICVSRIKKGNYWAWL